MSTMLSLFSLLSDVDVSYKTIERLYADEEVALVLHNLYMLILQERAERKRCNRRWNRYTLTIKKHYASEVEKHKDKAKDSVKLAKASKLKKKKMFVYSFALMDFKTRMYIAFGTSFKSERQAYNNAKAMAQETGVKLKSIRLDRHYSCQKYVRELGKLLKRPRVLPDRRAGW